MGGQKQVGVAGLRESERGGEREKEGEVEMNQEKKGQGWV